MKQKKRSQTHKTQIGSEANRKGWLVGRYTCLTGLQVMVVGLLVRLLHSSPMSIAAG